MNSKVLALMATICIITAVLFLVTSVIDTDGTALAKQYRKTQTVAQVNSCGNQILPANVTCSNSNSEVQGSDNGVNTEIRLSLPFP